MQAQYRFTILTATYNRARKLERTYLSIAEQTFSDFEWIIVDDGSSDDTAEVAQKLVERANFPVRYIYQENSQKHIAINRAVREAVGELLVVVDDDDEMKPNALERFDYYWTELKSKGLYDTFCCVTANCENHEGDLVGDPFPSDWFVSDSLELRVIHKIDGEKFGCQRMAVMREFPFREDIKRQAMPETLIWLPMAKKYKTLFVNDRLRIYYTDTESSVTTDRPWKNAVGAQRNHQMILNENLKFVRQNPKFYLKSAAAYSRYSFHLGRSITSQLREIKPALGKLLVCIGIPVGFVIYKRDRQKDEAKGIPPQDYTIGSNPGQTR